MLKPNQNNCALDQNRENIFRVVVLRFAMRPRDFQTFASACSWARRVLVKCTLNLWTFKRISRLCASNDMQNANVFSPPEYPPHFCGARRGGQCRVAHACSVFVRKYAQYWQVLPLLFSISSSPSRVYFCETRSMKRCDNYCVHQQQQQRHELRPPRHARARAYLHCGHLQSESISVRRSHRRQTAAG